MNIDDPHARFEEFKKQHKANDAEVSRYCRACHAVLSSDNGKLMMEFLDMVFGVGKPVMESKGGVMDVNLGIWKDGSHAVMSTIRANADHAKKLMQTDQDL